VQVGIKDGEVDYSGNCGNLMSAIGPYAVDTRVVDIDEDGPHPTLADNEPVTIRIYNTNTDKLIDATFPVSEGEAAVAYGDFAIDGVAGTGAKIKLDFLDPAGSKTGKMLPTGNAVDVFDGIRTTCIDVGNPCIMVLASKLGIDGTILPDETSQDTALLSRLERIRVQAAIKTGMATTPEDVPASIPKVCFVSPPSRHRLVSGRMQEEDEVDIVARAISVGQPHKALPITAGLSMCAAAGVEGSVVQTCLLSSGSSTLSPTGELMIGHASGRLDVGATFVDAKGGGKLLERVTVFRTARRLMDGVVYWK
jgi:2-methylaconitate cis-trans-isomerase PrpF